jgi:predicted DNA-binding WGR domain protein
METYLRRIDADQNMFRFYALDVQPTLFGEWTLIRRWGRIGREGRRMMMSFADRDGALEAREDWLRAKSQRGYRPIEDRSAPAFSARHRR